MKVNINTPGQIAFEKVLPGKLFKYELGVYCKCREEEDCAFVIYKQAGLMNAGEMETFKPDTLVISIKEATFVVGE